MCEQCQTRPVDEVVAGYRHAVRHRGWVAASVPTSPYRTGYSYTIGMTRHHGHPELLVSGLAAGPAARLLGDFADRVRAGQRFAAGLVLHPEGPYRFQLLDVADPSRLTHAQAVYAGPGGPVPALQVVWSDHDGHWPWERGWPGLAGDQPLFGFPVQR